MINDKRNILGDLDISKKQLSPFEAAQVARNLDSIERYREKNLGPMSRLEYTIGLIVGVAAWLLLIGLFIWAIFFA